VIVLNIVVGILTPGPLSDLRDVSNPFGLEGYPWVADARDVVILLISLCMLASTLCLVLRYRRSGGEVREQIKWIAFAASFMGLLYLGIMRREQSCGSSLY
jgi:NADH:ubiquinone oxidoreductase subunit 2 (subunit N)